MLWICDCGYENYDLPDSGETVCGECETHYRIAEELPDGTVRAIRLTPVAGDGAGGKTGDVAGETRPAPEHDG